MASFPPAKFRVNLDVKPENLIKLTLGGPSSLCQSNKYMPSYAIQVITILPMLSFKLLHVVIALVFLKCSASLPGSKDTVFQV